MCKCCVLLSTYNGSLFIREQIESIIEQSFDGEIIIFIRDDGSTDNTINIINDFVNIENRRIITKKGKNIGVQKSFLEIMNIAPQADYYAFCDQDDVWEAEKIEKLIDALRDINKPAISYSSYYITDSILNIMSCENIPLSYSDSITKILFHNKVPGCVMVFNNALLMESRKVNPDNVRMHDAYLLGLAYLTGKIIPVETALIKYRQHDNNAVGFMKKRTTVVEWLKEKKELLLRGEGYDISSLANSILARLNGFMRREDIEELEIIRDYRKSFTAWIKLLFSKKTVSQNRWRSTVSIKFKIFFRII